MGFLCSPQAASFPLPSQNRGSSSGFVLTLPCLRLHGHLPGSVLEAAPSSAGNKPFCDSAVLAEGTLSAALPLPGKLLLLAQAETLPGTRVSTSNASKKLPVHLHAFTQWEQKGIRTGLPKT